MLELLQISSSLEKQKLLSDIDPQSTTLVVSDLRAKFSAQNSFIQKFGFFESTAVLRANELWGSILKRFLPDFQIVSQDFIKTMICEIMENSRTTAAVLPDKGQVETAPNRDMFQNSEEIILEFLNLFMQVYSHPEAREHFVSWLEQNPGTNEKWGLWFWKSFEVAEIFLAQKKISSKWIAAFLSNQIGWENYWSKNLSFDLSAELVNTESELLRILSKRVDIKVIYPCLAESKQFSYLLQPYEELQNLVGGKKVPQGPNQFKNIETLRFTSTLAEAKFLTRRIRQLIESGVTPDQIAIVSPQIEQYWTTLEPLFAEEGIVVAKDSMARLHSIPFVGWWISRLRVLSQSFSYADLEYSNYFEGLKVDLRFEKFESLFRNLLDVDDLEKSKKIKQAFFESEIPRDPIDRNQFMGIMLKYWISPQHDEQLSLIVTELLKNTDESVRLRISNWIFWLEQILSKIEIRVQAGKRTGVQMTNILSAESQEIRFRFFIGMTEENFSQGKNNLISPLEIEKIYLDLGFHIAHPEQSSQVYELLWLLQNSEVKNTLCYPMCSPMGAEHSPHSLWTRFSDQQNSQFQVPDPIRMDYLFHLSGNELQKSKNWSIEQFEKISDQVECDQGQKKISPFFTENKVGLSPSALETYFSCPFKFAAQRLFKLVDPAEADLDPDNRLKGRLVHKLFEHLTIEPKNFALTLEEISTLLDGLHADFVLEVQKSDEYFGDARLWPPLRNQLARLGLRLLEFEKSLEFGKLKTIGRELRFKIPAEDFNRMLSLSGWTNFEWSGAVDRIDQAVDGSLNVIDYKPRDRKFAAKHWFSENHLQLAFYIWILAKGEILDVKSTEVAGAIYYIYRNFEMKGILPFSAESKNEIQQSIQGIEEKLKVFMAALVEGNFNPEPDDKIKTCEFCRWRRLCRAPHLNS